MAETMEMSPLERAARAALQALIDDTETDAWIDDMRDDPDDFLIDGSIRLTPVVRAVLQAIREPISDAIDYLIADAEAWETGAKDAAHEVYLMHCGKLRRDAAARLQAMIDAALSE